MTLAVTAMTGQLTQNHISISQNSGHAEEITLNEPSIIQWDKSAKTPGSALLIGNRDVIGLVHGRTEHERIPLYTAVNHVTSDSPASAAALFENGTIEFDSLCDLLLTFPGHDSFSNYTRNIDTQMGIGCVSYYTGDTLFTREIFGLLDGEILVIRLKSSGNHDVNCVIDLDNWNTKGIKSVSQQQIRLSGSTGVNEIEFQLLVQPTVDGGQITAQDGRFSIAGADAASIFIGVATEENGGLPDNAPDQSMFNAKIKPYISLLSMHTSRFLSLFQSQYLELDAPSPSVSEPAVSIKKQSQPGAYNPAIDMRLFNFGRYICIATGFRHERLQPSMPPMPEPANGGATQAEMDETNTLKYIKNAYTYGGFTGSKAAFDLADRFFNPNYVLATDLSSSNGFTIFNPIFNTIVSDNLVFSEQSDIFILPDIPPPWNEGLFEKTLPDTGDIVEVEWKNGLLTSALFHATTSGIHRFHTRIPIRVFWNDVCIIPNDEGRRIVQFHTTPGMSYILKPRRSEKSIVP